MIGFYSLEPLFKNILATGLVNKVFHSVQVVEIDGKKKPQAPVDGRWKYVGIDDTKGFSCYCRATGPMENVGEENIGSCTGKRYKTQTPHRLLFYNANEDRDHDGLSGILLNAVMSAGKMVRFLRLHTIPGEIIKDETGGAYRLATNAYLSAIDFLVILNLQADNCTAEILCEGIPNPY